MHLSINTFSLIRWRADQANDRRQLYSNATRSEPVRGRRKFKLQLPSLNFPSFSHNPFHRLLRSYETMSAEANREAWDAVAARDRQRWDACLLQWSQKNHRGADESIEHWANRAAAAVYEALTEPNTWDFFQVFMYRWFHTAPPKPEVSRHRYQAHAQSVFRARVDGLTRSQKWAWYRELDAWRQSREAELDAATAKRWEEELLAKQSSTAPAAPGPM